MENRLPHLLLRGALGVVALTLCAALPAGPRTLVVGTRSDPPRGTHPSLQAALDAARPGDVIRCPAGIHPLPLEVSLGVSIVGDPGARLDPTGGALRVHDVPHDQRFVLAGFGIVDGLELRLQLHDNHGPVHVCDVAVGAGRNPRVRGPSLWIRDCAQVALERVTTYGVPAVDAARVCDLLISDCVFTGHGSMQGRRDGPALRAEECCVAIAGGTLRGSDDPTGQLVAPAVEVDASALWITGCARLRGGSSGNNLFQSAVHGAGEASMLDLGPRVALNDGSRARSALTGRLEVTRDREVLALRAAPSRASLAAPSHLRVEASGPPDTNAVVMVSLPAHAVAWPGSPLGLWLDAATAVPLGALATGADGEGILEAAWPTHTGLGDLFAVQAAVWNDHGVEASLPALWWVDR